jgi:hypothetical protein
LTGTDRFSYHAAVLENATFFTLFARWPDEIRLFSIEWEMIESQAEALATLRQNARVVFVLRHDPDVPPRDVSQDLARAWLEELRAHGFDAEQDALPGFIAEHLRETERKAET